MPYVPNTDRDREEMLETVGASSIEELFRDIPGPLRRQEPLEVPGPLSEIELVRHVSELSSRNRVSGVLSFLGGGVYAHDVPSVVRHITGLPHFATAYTPYQAEASQGTLEAIYEFQSLIARLTGLDVANASMYDGASAAAEACLMSLDATGRRRVAVSSTVGPAVRAVARTYLAPASVEVVEVPARNGVTDVAALKAAVPGAAAFVFQHPNWFGLLEPARDLTACASAAGALPVASVDPLSLAVLAPPGSYGAEIAVGEGQCLGSPPGFGGPLLGFMAARKGHIRRLPGRIVGATVDTEGRRGYVMTLQTREQHIRREKAKSNICTNEGLVALAATVYLALLGERGFRQLAVAVASKAHYAASEIAKVPGVRLRFPGAFFREFVVELPIEAERARDELSQAGIWPGIPCGRHYKGMDRCLLVAVTELHTRADVDSLASGLQAVVSRRKPA